MSKKKSFLIAFSLSFIFFILVTLSGQIIALPVLIALFTMSYYLCITEEKMYFHKRVFIATFLAILLGLVPFLVIYFIGKLVHPSNPDIYLNTLLKPKFFMNMIDWLSEKELYIDFLEWVEENKN